jgi:hypothetical protein
MKKFVKVFFSVIVISVSFLLFVNFLSKREYSQEVYSSEEDTYWDITHVPEFPKVDGTIYDMALSADESILYVGGSFEQIGDVGGSGAVWTRDGLAAIDTATYQVTDWVPEVDGTVRAIKVYGSSIYIGGSFNFVNDTYTGEFAKLNSDGSLNTDCMPDIHSYQELYTAYSIQVTDDFIYVGGSFNRIGTGENEEVVTGLVRLNNNSSCTWDDSWTPALAYSQGIPRVYAMDIYGDDLYIGGSFDSIGGTPTGDFAKIDSTGQLDMNCMPEIYYDEPQYETVYSIHATEDFIYVGGSFNRVGENEVVDLVRLNNNSSCGWDSSWDPSIGNQNLTRTVYTISPIGNEVFVGGSFDSIGGLSGTEFALLDGTTGSAIQYWNPRIDNEVLTDTVYSSIVSGDQVYVGGSFNSVLGNTNYSGYGLAAFDYSHENVETVEIDTIEGLDGIRDNLRNNYVLIKDLDFEDPNSYADSNNMSTYTTGEGWEPIGYYSEEHKIFDPYYGIFDGQGHTISNLYINRPSEYYVGLFGLIEQGGVVKNLGLGNVSINGAGLTGAVVGKLMGTLENSFATGSVTALDECTGGLVGTHYIEDELLVTLTILNSYSEVAVYGGRGVGGVVGCNTGDIINSYSTGSVTGTSLVGGILGDYEGGDIIASFYDTEKAPGLDNPIYGLTTLQMKTISSYTDWDILAMNSFNPSDPSIWYISEGDDYPRLYWEYSAPEIETSSATSITSEGATLNGELTSMDGESEVEVYFQYREVGGEWIDVLGITKTSIGTFSSSISNLTLNTQYEYRAVVSWRDIGTVYGNTVSFSTLETPPLPTTFGEVISNIDDIQTPTNTEKELVFTKIGVGNITFSPGLNLVDNYSEVSTLAENLVIVYESPLNRFRAYVDTDGASFLAAQPAVLKFFNVARTLGVSGITTENFRTRLRVSVLDDSGNEVSDTSGYYNWDNAVYTPQGEILTLPVNHFSQYVLGATETAGGEELPQTGMDIFLLVLPMVSILFGILLIGYRKKIEESL